jgi:hypothetical protein
MGRWAHVGEPGTALRVVENLGLRRGSQAPLGTAGERRPAGGAERRGPGGQAEVAEEPAHAVRILDEGDELHAAAAAGTGLDVDSEGQAEELRPLAEDGAAPAGWRRRRWRGWLGGGLARRGWPG